MAVIPVIPCVTGKLPPKPKRKSSVTYTHTKPRQHMVCDTCGEVGPATASYKLIKQYRKTHKSHTLRICDE